MQIWNEKKNVEERSLKCEVWEFRHVNNIKIEILHLAGE